jgi:hypothetical protein
MNGKPLLLLQVGQSAASFVVGLAAEWLTGSQFVATGATASPASPPA